MIDIVSDKSSEEMFKKAGITKEEFQHHNNMMAFIMINCDHDVDKILSLCMSTVATTLVRAKEGGIPEDILRAALASIVESVEKTAAMLLEGKK